MTQIGSQEFYDQIDPWNFRERTCGECHVWRGPTRMGEAGRCFIAPMAPVVMAKPVNQFDQKSGRVMQGFDQFVDGYHPPCLSSTPACFRFIMRRPTQTQ